ncbi:MAG: hypothetical protein SF028_09610 [Candidatus Sumerlaeia bacterium]|nr:hypothetical protein [Candidatus Sumerlaeia bacterium]
MNRSAIRLGATLAIAATVALGASCARVKRVDPETEPIPGVMGIDSKDVILITDKMTRDMVSRVTRFQNPTGRPPAIAFFEIQNNTNQPMSTDLFLRRVRSQMFASSDGAFRFIDEAAQARIDQIRADKRAGTISASELKQLTGADFLLTGALDALSQSEGRRASNYVLMTMRLTDTETGEVAWESAEEFRRDRRISLF